MGKEINFVMELEESINKHNTNRISNIPIITTYNTFNDKTDTTYYKHNIKKRIS